MATAVLRTAARPRGFVAASGPDAEDFLQRMLSNDIESLGVGESCEALLLTPKARVVAPLRVWRRSEEEFLLLTEPELAKRVASQLARARFASKVEVEVEQHGSTLVVGAVLDGAVANDDYGEPACELIDADPPAAPAISADELELLRVAAGTPAWGKEIDERILPAEAGLVARAVSLTKGCYPGQEPIARLQYRGHANRRLCVLELEDAAPVAYDTPLVLDGREVGRITSAAADGGRTLALGYVRREVAPGALMSAAGRRATIVRALPG